MNSAFVSRLAPHLRDFSRLCYRNRLCSAVSGLALGSSLLSRSANSQTLSFSESAPETRSPLRWHPFCSERSQCSPHSFPHSVQAASIPLSRYARSDTLSRHSASAHTPPPRGHSLAPGLN